MTLHFSGCPRLDTCVNHASLGICADPSRQRPSAKKGSKMCSSCVTLLYVSGPKKHFNTSIKGFLKRAQHCCRPTPHLASEGAW